MLVYPIFHFLYGPGVATIVPPWIPWRLFWTYFTGATISAAGLSILLRKHSHIPALSLGTEILLFVLLIDVLLIFPRPGDAWAERSMFGDLPGRLNNAFKDFRLSGAVFIFAGTQSEPWRTLGKDTALTLGRLIVGLPLSRLEHCISFTRLLYQASNPCSRAFCSFSLAASCGFT
jgi:hypothetical protein